MPRYQFALPPIDSLPKPPAEPVAAAGDEPKPAVKPRKKWTKKDYRAAQRGKKQKARKS